MRTGLIYFKLAVEEKLKTPYVCALPCMVCSRSGNFIYGTLNTIRTQESENSSLSQNDLKFIEIGLLMRKYKLSRSTRARSFTSRKQKLPCENKAHLKKSWAEEKVSDLQKGGLTLRNLLFQSNEPPCPHFGHIPPSPHLAASRSLSLFLGFALLPCHARPH